MSMSAIFFLPPFHTINILSILTLHISTLCERDFSSTRGTFLWNITVPYSVPFTTINAPNHFFKTYFNITALLPTRND